MPRIFKQGAARRGGPANLFRRVRRARAPLAPAAGLSVDGLPAVAGQTVFPGSSFDTAEDSRSALELGNRARLELSGATTIRLEFSDESLGGALGAGAAR